MFHIIFKVKNVVLSIILFISKLRYYKNSINIYQMYETDEKKNAFEYFKKDFKTSVFLESQKEIRKFAILKSLENSKIDNFYNLEFGVYKGTSTNLFSKYIDKMYAFDSFEGLKEDWEGYILPKGTFNLNKKIPRLRKNVVPVAGWVQDTLPNFLKEHNPKINFVHMDLDTYPSTKFVLEAIKGYLVKDSVILFDELYNYPGWDIGELKALEETFDKTEYKYIAFCIKDKQVAIQYIGNPNT